MIALILPKEAQLTFAKAIRRRRLQLNKTQQHLAEQSGVSLAVLRKFEQTGKISLESFLKLAGILDLLRDLVAAVEEKPPKYNSIDEVLADSPPKLRERARPK